MRPPHRLRLAALALTLPLAATACAPKPQPGYVFAARAAASAGPYGFVDPSSITTAAAQRRVNFLMVAPSKPAAGGKSYITGQVTIDCGTGQTFLLSAQDFDDAAAPVGPARQGSLGGATSDMGQMDAVTRALICGGSAAPANPPRFATVPAAIAWVRSGAH